MYTTYAQKIERTKRPVIQQLRSCIYLYTLQLQAVGPRRSRADATERSVFFFEALIILTGRARSFYAKIPDSLVPSATLRDKTSHVHEPACIKKRAQTQHGDIVCRGALRRLRCIIMHASIATLVRVVRFFSRRRYKGKEVLVRIR